MILIIGGSYQGKKKFAVKKYHLEENDIIDLSNGYDELDKYKCINHFEKIVLLNKDISIDSLKDKIIIFEDIFCGVVPIDKKDRINRELAGNILQELSKKADKVYLVTAGIAEELK